MILTDRFVYIHMPKTGGTFVTSVLERLHTPNPTRLQRLLRHMQRRRGLKTFAFVHRRYGPLLNVEPKHGTCHDIPETHRHLPILSCMRGPYVWYVSQYEFSWWKRIFQYNPSDKPTPAGWAIEQALPQFIASHSHFPEVSFPEFLDLCQAAANIYNRQDGTDLGLYTHGFVRYFYRDPRRGVGKPLDAHVKSEEHANDMFNVLFLNTECLKDELQRALVGFGYKEKDLEFIAGMGKILPMGIGRRDDQAWQTYYTDPLRAEVRRRDALLFQMFPAFDV
jgi:hypothetical protein